MTEEVLVLPDEILFQIKLYVFVLFSYRNIETLSCYMKLFKKKHRVRLLIFEIAVYRDIFILPSVCEAEI